MMGLMNIVRLDRVRRHQHENVVELRALLAQARLRELQTQLDDNYLLTVTFRTAPHNFDDLNEQFEEIRKSIRLES